MKVCNKAKWASIYHMVREGQWVYKMTMNDPKGEGTQNDHGVSLRKCFLLFNQLLVMPDNQTLQRILATLFSHQRKYDKAMAMYLKLGHKDV